MTFDKAAFYTALRTKASGLSTAQVAAIEIILDTIAGSPLSWASYKLATAWHETNRTMEPVIEAYWLSEAWRKAHLRYYPWFGRGLVQLTWEVNYKRADKKLVLGGALVKNPELARRPDIAAKVLHKGMDEGWFTGVKCSSVLPSSGTATREQYMNARTIINGRDKSDLVEDYAQCFERALRDGGWS